MKKLLIALAMLAAIGLLRGLVLAQDLSGGFGANIRPDRTWQSFDATKGGAPTAPKYCSAVLSFYGGDTDTSSSDWAAGETLTIPYSLILTQTTCLSWYLRERPGP